MDGIEDVVQEIVKKCHSLDVPCSEYLAAFVARTIVQANASTFALDTKITKDGLEELVTLSVGKIIQKDSPSVETLKMQVSFNASRIVHEKERKSKSDSRLREREDKMDSIVHKSPSNVDESEYMNQLYIDIFHFVRGSRIDIISNSVEIRRRMDQEIYKTIESVFPKATLNSFFLSTIDEKRKKLDEISEVVLGIQLFNKECRNKKPHFANMYASSIHKVKMLEESLRSYIEKTNDKSEEYREALIYAKLRRNLKISETQSCRLNDELINRRQFLRFVEEILQETKTCRNSISSILETYESAIGELRSTINNKSSVPKEYVFPKFAEASKLNDRMSCEIDFAQDLSHRLENLLEFENSFNSTLENVIELKRAERKESHESPKKSIDQPEMILSLSANSRIIDQNTKHEGMINLNSSTGADLSDRNDDTETSDQEHPILFDPVEHKINFADLILEFDGFCPSTIANQNGLLLSGKPELGVAHFQGKNFVFNSIDLLSQFTRDPKTVIDKVKIVAGKKPELISLLSMQGYLTNASFQGLEDIEKEMLDFASRDMTSSKVVSMSNCLEQIKHLREHLVEFLIVFFESFQMDASTETPTHFLESKIDMSYYWNEWEMRIQAIKEADLRTTNKV